MKILFIAALLQAVIGVQLEEDVHELQYVFEIVRHGARGPMIEDPRFTKEPS